MQTCNILLFVLFFQIVCIYCEFYPSTGCGSSNEPASNSTAEEFLQHNNIERSYLIHIPPTYDHSLNEGYPLILNLHGFTGNAWWSMSGSLMNQHSDQNNYIAVYPQGTTYGVTVLDDVLTNLTSWNDLSCSGSPSVDGPTCSQTAFEIDNVTVTFNITHLLPVQCQDIFQCNWCNCIADDVDFIDTLLDVLESKYCIDRSRVYATGFSNGGMMTQRLGCELNHRLAAIAPMHGQAALGYNCAPKYNLKMPIINIWGTTDDVLRGDTIVDPNGGFYFTSVYQVMYKYGLHNKCNVNNRIYESIETVSDGILEWKCVGYDQCRFDGNSDEYNIDVMSCSWNGSHTDPVLNNNNFGLDVVWDFFKNNSKAPDQLNEEEGDNDEINIIIGVSMGIVILIIIIAVIMWRCCMQNKNQIYDNLDNSTQPLSDTVTK